MSLSSPDTYMYRIIGITDNSTTNTDLNIPENSLKIIKASKYGGSVVWNGSNGATWDEASINTTALNTTFYNSIAADWQAKILANHYWWIGDNSVKQATTEATAKSSTNKPIGLMYRSDYYNAGNQDTNNWLFIKNGWSTNTVEYEWTMSRYGSTSAWRVNFSNGGLYYYSMTDTFAVRPVFYLVSGVTLNGSGRDSDPYLIDA